MKSIKFNGYKSKKYNWLLAGFVAVAFPGGLAMASEAGSSEDSKGISSSLSNFSISDSNSKSESSSKEDSPSSFKQIEVSSEKQNSVSIGGENSSPKVDTSALAKTSESDLKNSIQTGRAGAALLCLARLCRSARHPRTEKPHGCFGRKLTLTETQRGHRFFEISTGFGEASPGFLPGGNFPPSKMASPK